MFMLENIPVKNQILSPTLPRELDMGGGGRDLGCKDEHVKLQMKAKSLINRPKS